MEDRGTLEVLSNAFKISKDPQAIDRNGRPIRILEVYCGGMMRGAYAASASAVLQNAGLGNVAVAYGAYSAGGPTALAKELKLAHLTAPVYEQLEDLEIFKRAKGRLTFDLSRLMATLGPIFDESAIQDMRAEVHMIVTDPETGDHELLDVKRSMPNGKAAIAATMAMPMLYPCVEVNGFKWCDGAWANLKLALAALIKKFHPTDIMVFVNSPKYPDFLERMGTFYGNQVSQSTTAAIKRRTALMDADVEDALDWLVGLPKVRSWIARPDSTKGFFPWTTAPRIVRLAIDEMRSFMEGKLEDAYAGKFA
ncbi:MAG: patatin-like phospholipase family protein [Minisyncoccia bacterium]